MMGEVSEQFAVNYQEGPGSRFVAQPVDDFLFTSEKEMRSAEKSISIDEDEGFSETMRSPAPQQPPAMEPRPALPSIQNGHNSSAARQPFN